MEIPARQGRHIQRLNATNAGQPDIMTGRTEATYYPYPGMEGMADNVFIETLSRSYVVTAELTFPMRAPMV